MMNTMVRLRERVDFVSSDSVISSDCTFSEIM